MRLTWGWAPDAEWRYRKTLDKRERDHSDAQTPAARARISGRVGSEPVKIPHQPTIFSYRFRSMKAEHFEFVNGPAQIHHRLGCVGPCPFHNPSEHKLSDAPMVRRASGLIERLCEHGIGHPDPDSVKWLDAHGDPMNAGTWAEHTCCGWPIGCCGDRMKMEPLVSPL